jgi:hypothetical protein
VSKYGNKKVKEDGYTFDSQGEHRRYLQLRLLARQGLIRDLQVHKPSFELAPKSKDAQGPIRAVSYVPDFTYWEDGVWVVEDVKGVQTDVFKLKWNLLRRKMLGQGAVRLVILALKDV